MADDGVGNADIALHEANPKRIDLMGDAVYFEGLRPDDSGDGYTIYLGS